MTNELADEMAELGEVLGTLRQLPETVDSYVTIRITRADQHVEISIPQGKCSACGEEVIAGPHAFDIRRRRIAGVASTVLYHRWCNPDVDWNKDGESEATWAGPVAVVAEALAAADRRVQPLAQLRWFRYSSEYTADHLSWRDFAQEVREDLELIDRIGVRP
jgi:hypothetical protein